MQFADTFVQTDLGLYFMFTESMDTAVYVDKQRIHRSDSTNADIDLPSQKHTHITLTPLNRTFI